MKKNYLFWEASISQHWAGYNLWTINRDRIIAQYFLNLGRVYYNDLIKWSLADIFYYATFEEFKRQIVEIVSI